MKLQQPAACNSSLNFDSEMPELFKERDLGTRQESKPYMNITRTKNKKHIL
jgi:hypothetical protein